jgi:hypothetical protein
MHYIPYSMSFHFFLWCKGVEYAITLVIEKASVNKTRDGRIS